jgi:hypothetical protein
MACALLRESTSFGSEDEDDATNEEEPMEAFKCGHCGRKFNSQEELQQHEKECVPARVK